MRGKRIDEWDGNEGKKRRGERAESAKRKAGCGRQHMKGRRRGNEK
jgi:hypothetical protein